MRTATTLLLCALLVAPLPAQGPFSIAPIKPAGKPFIRSYKPVIVPPLRPPNSLRLRGLIRAGNLYLTVHDAIALALESNLDLEIERYNLVATDWQVQRLQSGGLLRGVTGASAAVVNIGAGQGVAGSQSGGGGTGGGGTATINGAALIQQIGPVTPQLDPVYTMSSTFGHSTRPQTRIVQSGTNELVYNARSYFGSVSEGLITGGTVRMSYSGSYVNEAIPTDVLNPTSFISMSTSITHSLLSGFGERVNGRFIRAAIRRSADSRQNFKARLIGVVTNVLNSYWDYSVATEDIKYRTRNRDLARELYEATQKQIAVGAVPAIDLVRTQTARATQEQALSVALNAAQVRENALKDLLSWHGEDNAELAAAHIIAVDPIQVPDSVTLAPISELLSTAMSRRPEVALARMNTEIAQINAVGTANGLLPNLRVSLSTQNVGQTGAVVPGQKPDAYFVGGAGSALGQVFRRNFPNESAAASFSARLKNTQAQADFAIDQLTQRQGELLTQRTMNDLAMSISTQVLGLRQAHARYRAAVESRGLQEKLLAGEERKLQYGTTTIAAVVQARRDLANAQSIELATAAAYLHSRIALDRDVGLTLENNDVVLDEAIAGAVK